MNIRILSPYLYINKESKKNRALRLTKDANKNKWKGRLKAPEDIVNSL